MINYNFSDSFVTLSLAKKRATKLILKAVF